MSEAADVEISIGEYGVTKFVVNGKDISEEVVALGITSSPNAAPVYTVSLQPGPFELSGKGIVKVAVKGNDTKADTLAFIQSLNATAIEGKALNNLGWGDSTTQAILDEIIRIAEARL